MELLSRHCEPLPKGTPALDADSIAEYQRQLHADWVVSNDRQRITRDYRFKNYYQTMAFVNALAWIAHQQDHHPDLEVGYNHCRVHFSTHSIGGLSLNDFICAARIDALLPAVE